MVHLDRIPAIPAQSLENLNNDLDNFGIRRHSIVGAGNIEIALVELPHSALGDSRLTVSHHQLAIKLGLRQTFVTKTGIALSFCYMSS